MLVAMAKTWVLDTETKGTGAHIAPLERDAGAAPAKLDLVQLHPKPPAPASEDELQAAPQPRRFKVVDVFSGSVLAEDVDAPAALRALRSLRKPLDALMYVRDEDSRRWRLLTLAETDALWALRERA